MSRLTDLIRATKAKDAALGAELEREFKALSSRRQFGLNFERHRPEAVELPQRPVRKGDKVRILPPRGSTERGDQRLWQVTRVQKQDGARIAHLRLIQEEGETTTCPTDDLVVVAEFRDPIYPGLVSTGKVERGGDKPFHTVINAENHHALKALAFTHKGKVDAIYIDPPYNTGARDWKYNNDYVEGDDLYRHSKWLAFMERRLLLARELLNPADSVLIVTIDEKEYLRLGLLLEQLLPEARIQMVTIVTNPNGVARGAELARVEEYAFFCFFGVAGPGRLQDTLLGDDGEKPVRRTVRWEWLMRGGSNSRRVDRPNLFYPIYVDEREGRIAQVGDPIPIAQDPASVAARAGLTALWPIRESGEEANWRTSAEYLRDLLEKGYAKLGAFNKRSGRWSVLYLGKAQIRRIRDGEIRLTGRAPDGALMLEAEDSTLFMTPKTVWNRKQHSAGEYGSRLLRSMLPGRSFPFPKSIYAVEDSLKVVVANKPDAVILDFFSGSGTTAHAVMRLNRQDGGQRQCISVTNNEVSAEEQRRLRSDGLRPGDPDWEALGICDHVTKPRIMAAITGRTPDGEPVKGDYRFTDEFPMADGFEENVEFFTLAYEAPVAVGHNRAFDRIAPLLWLRAGARGDRIGRVPTKGWAVVEAYGILFDLDQAKLFCDAMAEARAALAFVVTDDDRRFQAVVRRLPEGVEPVRLYESYLSNFRFASGE